MRGSEECSGGCVEGALGAEERQQREIEWASSCSAVSNVKFIREGKQLFCCQEDHHGQMPMATGSPLYYFHGTA